MLNLNIYNLPYDTLNLISNYLDYFSYMNIKLSCKEMFKFKNLTYKNKADIINNFFYKKFYLSFKDMKLMNRTGYLVNLDMVLKNPDKYRNLLIQCISWFQYNFQYIEAGNIIEGNLFKHHQTNAWLIKDNYTNKYHPFLNPFIFPKSIRVIKLI